eukprot:973062-Rhodomonas_salina.2
MGRLGVIKRKAGPESRERSAPPSPTEALCTEPGSQPGLKPTYSSSGPGSSPESKSGGDSDAASPESQLEHLPCVCQWSLRVTPPCLPARVASARAALPASALKFSALQARLSEPESTLRVRVAGASAGIYHGTSFPVLLRLSLIHISEPTRPRLI